MSSVVEVTNKYMARQKPKKPINTDENIWRASQDKPYLPSGRPNQAKSDPVKCFNCGKEGHVRRECPACAYCKETNHAVKTCPKRLKDSKGKFCKTCQLKDSHNTSECFRRRRMNRGRGNVRVLQRGIGSNTEYPMFEHMDSEIYSEKETSEQTDSD